MKRQKLIQIWQDRKIPAGDDWAGEIDSHLNSADLITLLVSSDFLNSDYCYEKEMVRAMERHETERVPVVPIIIRQCDWNDAPFGGLQAIPLDGKPVASWDIPDEAWTEVAKLLKLTVKGVLQRLQQKLLEEGERAARASKSTGDASIADPGMIESTQVAEGLREEDERVRSEALEQAAEKIGAINEHIAVGADKEQLNSYAAWYHYVSAPRVFISYSHDSPEHEDRVLALANRLRLDGIDAQMDQYNPAPPQGWPRWMEREIQAADFVLLVCTETYLRRVQGREEPGRGRGVVWESDLIYTLLYESDPDFQRFIPVLFSDSQSVLVPLPIRGLTHYRVDTEQGYENLLRHLTNQPGTPIPPVGQRRSLPRKEPQSYPSSPAAKTGSKMSDLETRHRRQLIKQVRLDWIEGLLKQSLYKVARIELELTEGTNDIEQPLNAMLQGANRSRQRLVPATSIGALFDEQAGALLILGAPGSGKTTLLLELARELLDRADHDQSLPIPVIFPLSSWAAKQQPLSKWLIAELNERSYVPKRIANKLIETEQIIPLLDGLDEVPVQNREASVRAINAFRREHGLLPIAVCSRTADYETLSLKLRLGAAIRIESLKKSQVEDYLARAGNRLQALRSAIAEDTRLLELLETPLMLWVATLAYRDAASASLSNTTLERQQHQLFMQFVETMLHRRSSRTRYSSSEITSWLAWLATTVTRNNRAIFYLEDLDFAVLPHLRQRLMARFAVISIAAAVYALALGWTGFAGGQKFGLYIGALVGLLGTLIKLQPVEKTAFSRAGIVPRTREAVSRGLMFGSLFGLAFGLTYEYFRVPEAANGLLYGLSVAVLFGGIATLVRFFTSDAMPETRARPNQGTRRSALMAVAVGLILAVLTGPFCIFFAPTDLAFMLWKPIGLLVGLTGGFLSGGLFTLKHVVLRLALWATGAAPFKYVAFLENGRELQFLRRVGAGYIFTHRLLREYFASSAAANQGSGS